MSTTIKDVKIPYPTEGVIRSAQLNDTVCPENSVQLAINMNFDRIENYLLSLEIQCFHLLNLD